MNAEIISVGTELMLGDIPNTDAQYISSRLVDMGVNVICHSTVNDSPKDIRQALSYALPRSSVIIFTGGLGPTPDDLTKETVCSAVGVELKMHEESRRLIDDYFYRTGRKPSENNYKQAMLPVGGTVFKNEVGTAPGCAISAGKQWIIMLPGPPKELIPMFDKEVIPYLREAVGGEYTAIKNISVFGIGESRVAQMTDGYLHSKNPVVATYVSSGVVTVKVTVKGSDKGACNALCDKTVKEITAILGDNVFSVNNETLAQVVVEKLKAARKKVATAESCTAGMLSSAITTVKGSSDVISTGFVTYSDEAKCELLGIDREFISRYGVYSREVSCAMARSAARLGHSDIGIGITGIASAYSESELPAGLVFVSLFDGENCYTRRLMLGHGSDDEREKVREGAVNNALDMCRLYLDNKLDKVGNIANTVLEPGISAAVAGLSSEKPAEKQPENDLQDNAATGDISSLIPSIDDIEAAAEPSAMNNDGANAESEDIYSDSSSEKTAKNTKKDGDDSENENKFIRFLRSWLPWRGDSRRNKIRKTALIVFALIFLASAVYIVDYYVESIRTKNEINNVQKLYDPTAEGELDSHGINVNFASLIEKNSDTVGWLYVPGTQVNNPVVQSDNEKYLTTDFEGTKNRHGALFVDENCTIAPGKLSSNTVIYGHHMRDGTMFGELKKYRTDQANGLEFYKENPIIEFTTIYQTKATKWKIFAVFVSNADAQQDNGYVFRYWQNSFVTDREHAQFIYECQRRSMINAPVDVTPDDFIITLSTCVYDFNNARLVVMARLLRNGESEEIDSAAATVNYNAKFPAAYYGGGSVPEDKTSSVVSVYNTPSVASSSAEAPSATESASSENSSADVSSNSNNNNNNNNNSSDISNTPSDEPYSRPDPEPESSSDDSSAAEPEPSSSSLPDESSEGPVEPDPQPPADSSGSEPPTDVSDEIEPPEK